jgi:Fur family peroxide stress response transcriptional regulator
LTGVLLEDKFLIRYSLQIGLIVKVDRTEVERRVESFREAARKAGVKLTHQRFEIFRAVAASLEHPNAEKVFRALQPRMPTLSLDTVYRTLWLLNDLGCISTLGVRREAVRFDANLAHHHHYLCVRCGLARDFESVDLNALRIPKTVKEFGRILGTHVEVRGVCGRCAKEPPQESRGKRPREMKSKKNGAREERS